MNEMTVQIVSLLFLLAPLPLIVYGVLEGVAALWWLGIALVIVGGVIPPLTRFVFEEEDEQTAGGDESS